MRTFRFVLTVGLFLIVSTATARATITGFTPLAGSQAVGYVAGTPEPLPFTLVANGYNDNILYVWNERQNVTLASNLKVDRVANPAAPYITGSPGNYEILAGTMVSSHYVQWDPGPTWRVYAEMEFDSEIFAFITADQKLFNSDAILGLAQIDYSDFVQRGLETTDIISWTAPNVVRIDWDASNPGDWTRLITAYSPGGETIPAPGAILLCGIGAGLLGWLRPRRIL